MYQMLLFDEAQYIRSKVKTLVKHFHIETFEAGNIAQLNKVVIDANDKFDLLLVDLNFDNEPIIKWFEKYIEQHPFIPMIIYTSTVTRSNMVSGIRLGAKDYILKSSDDDVLIERIMKHIQEERPTEIKVERPEEIKFNLDTFFNSEIRKAQKGKYEMTICMSSIQPADQTMTGVTLSYNEGSSIVQKFKPEYWETDVMFQFGARAFVSFFPFCGFDQIGVVDHKLQNIFSEIKKDKVSLRGFILVNSYVTYPHDGEDKHKILLKLEKIMQS